MEELSWEVKIIGVALYIGAVILLAVHEKLIKMLRRSPKPGKTK